MTNDIASSDIRDQVLRKIGRNVVNFQKMESMLKILNTQQGLTGSINEIEGILEKRTKSTSKQSMGQLAGSFVQSAYSNIQQEPPEQKDPQDFSVSFSFRINMEASLVAERKKALRAVVAERNKLIHRWLASFDPNSLDSCEQLRVALDEQHARIMPEFEALKSIVLAVRTMMSQTAQQLTPELLERLAIELES